MKSSVKSAHSNGSRRLWRAVISRDARLDGAFVYAVCSTGVYCLPSCPSRKPRRDRVLFFTGPEEAEERGFRPCLRCRPRDARAPSAAPWIGRACRFIESQAGAPVCLSDLSVETGIPPLRMQRTFHHTLGVSPRRYDDAVRLKRFKERLRQGDNVTTALYAAGYGSPSRVYERSDVQLGMTPDTYRRGGAGMDIGYSVVASPLGRLLVAGTARGLSAVYLGDSGAVLEAVLREEYPAARIRRNSARVSHWVERLIRHMEGTGPRLSIPLDVQATAFQRRVWDLLRKIPYGETRSYGQISRALGRPKAARAVARACATNPAAVLIPCHRVLRADGRLGGYRWGLSRKLALLDRERGFRKNGKAPYGTKPQGRKFHT